MIKLSVSLNSSSWIYYWKAVKDFDIAIKKLNCIKGQLLNLSSWLCHSIGMFANLGFVILGYRDSTDIGFSSFASTGLCMVCDN